MGTAVSATSACLAGETASRALFAPGRSCAPATIWSRAGCAVVRICVVVDRNQQGGAFGFLLDGDGGGGGGRRDVICFSGIWHRAAAAATRLRWLAEHSG